MPSKKKSKTKRHGKAAAQSIVDFDSALQLHLQGNLDAAESAYRTLIEKNSLDARYRHVFGRLLHQQGRIEEAIASVQLSLTIRPENGRALNDLALLYQEAGRFDEAVACFLQLIDLEPENSTASNNLGCCLKQQGRLAEAVAAFTQAAAQDRQNADAFCNLGNTLQRLEDWTGAQGAFRQALEIDPEMLDVYPNLVAVLRRGDLLDEASEIIQQWIQQDPNNAVAKHMQGAISSQSPPDRASQEYVREIFDVFAETFDQQLESLDYRGPNLISKALAKVLPHPKADCDVLDAGCGTGLCGEILKAHARHLVGVDLSSKMLERARALGVYDELITIDIVEYLNANPSKFDIVVSADTFGYFGDLRPVLASIRASLKNNGILICTIETSQDGEIDSKDFQLMKTGRFRHSRNYLITILAETDFSVRELVMRTLRTEAEQPVPCFLVEAVTCTVD